MLTKKPEPLIDFIKRLKPREKKTYVRAPKKYKTERTKIKYSVRVNDREFVKYYNRWKKKLPNYKQIKEEEKLLKMGSSIFKEIAERVATNEAGVIMRGWGYFFVMRSAAKRFWVDVQEDGTMLVRPKKAYEGRLIEPVFIPRLNGQKNFQGWSFDYGYVNLLRKRIKNNTKKGWKYKMYPYTVIRLNIL
jgi:hypothetical protein